MTRVGPERDSPTKEDSQVICVVNDNFSVTLPLLYNTSDCSRFFRPIRRPWHKQRAAIPHPWSPSTWPAGSSEAGGGVLL